MIQREVLPSVGRPAVGGQKSPVRGALGTAARHDNDALHAAISDVEDVVAGLNPRRAIGEAHIGSPADSSAQQSAVLGAGSGRLSSHVIPNVGAIRSLRLHDLHGEKQRLLFQHRDRLPYPSLGIFRVDRCASDQWSRQQGVKQNSHMRLRSMDGSTANMRMPMPPDNIRPVGSPKGDPTCSAASAASWLVTRTDSWACAW